MAVETEHEARVRAVTNRLLERKRRAVLAYGSKVARTWGAIAAGAQLRGRRRPANDTWVAACCIDAGLPLLTQNRRDFVDFAEHDGLVLL